MHGSNSKCSVCFWTKVGLGNSEKPQQQDQAANEEHQLRCGGNVIMCDAVGQHVFIHRHAQLGLCNTPCLPTFLDKLKNILIFPKEEEQELPTNVGIYYDWLVNNPWCTVPL